MFQEKRETLLVQMVGKGRLEDVKEEKLRKSSDEEASGRPDKEGK